MTSGMINGQLGMQVGMTVLKKSLDAQEGQMTQLLQSVAPVQTNAEVGNNLDVRA